MSSQTELCFFTAREQASLVRSGQVSARELVNAHLEQIETVNPEINAVITLVAEAALEDARIADDEQARGKLRGPLHGLPIAHKDLAFTKGIRTTRGSPLFQDFIPDQDEPFITRLKSAGAITIGKTNTPEFGCGSQTFNTIFGATRNPYDRALTCGGSSGGAAAALASGMMPIADGSDMGGSLRNPAAFCNVVGLRPSPGRVPSLTSSWSPLAVAGPMARNVGDTALLLSVMSGYDGNDPLSLSDPQSDFSPVPRRSLKGARVAWWKGLGGIPVQKEIAGKIDSCRAIFEALGCTVEEAEPDFTNVDRSFLTLRHLALLASIGPLHRIPPGFLKATIRWELERAAELKPQDISDAMVHMSSCYAKAASFFKRYDFFILPVTQVVPFDVNTPYPTSIEGIEMDNYVDWMRSCWYISFLSVPAISVPAGFTAGGLPVGLQIAARHRGEAQLLNIASAFEEATGEGFKRPAICQPAD